MPAVSFAKHAPSAAPAPTTTVAEVPTPVAGVTVETTTTACEAPATPTPAPTPTPTSAFAIAKRKPLLGDFIPSFSDIIMPRINISQQIGELKNSFAPGTIVFKMTTALFTGPIIDPKTNTIATPATEPLTVVCLGFRPTRYVEKVPGGGRGMIVDTEDQVRANGGTLSYQEHKLKEKDGMKRFEELAEAFIAIQRPSHLPDDNNIFVYEVEGKKYALALYGMRGMAYTVAKDVFFTNRRMGCLMQGYPTRIFSMTTRWKPTQGTNGAWIPVLIPGASTSQEYLSWVASVLNPEEAAPEGN